MRTVCALAGEQNASAAIMRSNAEAKISERSFSDTSFEEYYNDLTLTKDKAIFSLPRRETDVSVGPVFRLRSTAVTIKY